MRRQTRPEHVGHQDELAFLADRTGDPSLLADVGRGPDQFRVGIADLVATETTAAVLVDQRAAYQPMVDDAATDRAGTSHRTGPEGHVAQVTEPTEGRPRTAIACHVGDRRAHLEVALHLSYGPDVPHDGELRLCGDVAAKRVIELGIAAEVNAIALARAGAKAIAVDPDPARIAAGRSAAEADGIRVEFHQR